MKIDEFDEFYKWWKEKGYKYQPEDEEEGDWLIVIKYWAWKSWKASDMKTFEEQIPPNSISRFEYDDLLERTRYYFELMDAITIVRSLLFSKGGQPKRYDAYQRLAVMAEEAKSDLRKLIT